MFDSNGKNQPEYGVVAAEDDSDIEVLKVKPISHGNLGIELIRLLRDVILVLAVFGLMLVFVVQPVVVEGNSMQPFLHNGERLLVDKLIYYKLQSVSWGHIERGDVVVFWYPKDPDKSFVKRVIGLPGDTVEVRNGVVFVNNNEMRELYLDPAFNQTGTNYAAKKVEEHYYFVMGDNRDNSLDSRYWGLVPEKYIYGKVFFRYWMPANLGFINKGAFELNNTVDNDDRAADQQPHKEK